MESVSSVSAMLSFSPIFTGAPAGLVFATGFALLVLSAGAWDVTVRRIPNALVLVLALLGVLFCLVTFGVASGMLRWLGGLTVGLAIWIAFYAFGILGAGDVKFFAAAASWLGPSLAWRAALVAACVGGILATAFLVRDSQVGSTVRRLVLIPFTRGVPLQSLDELSPQLRRRQMPYGVAMGIGVLVMACFSNLWS